MQPSFSRVALRHLQAATIPHGVERFVAKVIKRLETHNQKSPLAPWTFKPEYHTQYLTKGPKLKRDVYGEKDLVGVPHMQVVIRGYCNPENQWGVKTDFFSHAIGFKISADGERAWAAFPKNRNPSSPEKIAQKWLDWQQKTEMDAIRGHIRVRQMEEHKKSPEHIAEKAEYERVQRLKDEAQRLKDEARKIPALDAMKRAFLKADIRLTVAKENNTGLQFDSEGPVPLQILVQPFRGDSMMLYIFKGSVEVQRKLVPYQDSMKQNIDALMVIIQKTVSGLLATEKQNQKLRWEVEQTRIKYQKLKQEREEREEREEAEAEKRRQQEETDQVWSVAKTGYMLAAEVGENHEDYEDHEQNASYVVEVQEFTSKKDAMSYAEDRGPAYVVKGTQMWNEPIGQVEEHDRDAWTYYVR